MKPLILLLTLIVSLTVAKAGAFSLDDIFLPDSFSMEIFPEEKHQEIQVNNIRSPLEYKANEEDRLGELQDIIKPNFYEGIEGALSQSGLFNTFSMGTGVVDVTFQVKNGVSYALKENLKGYTEFERRKICEEFLNANFNSHKTISNFLLRSSMQKNSNKDNSVINIIETIFDFFDNDDSNKAISFNQLINNIITQSSTQKLFHLLQYFALSLLTLILMAQIALELFDNGLDFGEIMTKPIFKLIKIWLLIFLLPTLMDTMMALTAILQNAIITLIENLLLDTNSYLDNLKLSWADLANKIGYLPASLLSIADIIGQFYAIVFLGGVILHIILGKILSPLWALGIAIDQLKSSCQNSLIEWLKSIFLLSLLPICFLLVNQIISEIQVLEIPFIDLSLNIAKFYYFPQFSNLILARLESSNTNVFSSYKRISADLNNYFNEAKALLELSRNKNV